MTDSHASRPIRLLPPALRNQIAAGEVVERPASVLKELVENSLDAGAGDISVTLEDGGQRLLTVRDNGRGIAAQDLELALTRHATSKVASFTDLLHVASYGFRGEALPSIASVADVTLESAHCPEEGECAEGAFIHVRHGEVTGSGPSALQRGTLVTVRDLFTNVPARLKFLKTPATELKRCQESLIRLALARPQTSFSLQVAGESGTSRELLRIPAHLPLRERLMRIWPPQVTENLIPFAGERHGIRLHGLTASPQTLQGKGDRVLLYVNARNVNDRLLLRAVREAYKGKLTSREYPQIALFLEIDPQEVDVNVHPAKSEVRFRDERAVFGAVLKVLEEALCAHSPALNAWEDGERGWRPMRGEHGEKDGNHAFAESSPRPPRPEGFWGRLDFPRLMELPQRPAWEEPDAESHDPPEAPPHENTEQAALSTRQVFGASGAPAAGTSGHIFSQARPTALASSVTAYSPVSPGPQDPPFAPSNTGSRAASPWTPEEASSPGRGEAAGYPVKIGPYLCLGQVADSYLILLEQNCLLLLDQHAAHERVLLYSIRQQAEQAQSQLLTVPVELNLHPAEAERLHELYPRLAQLGYDVHSDPGALSVRGVPPLLGRKRGLEMLQDILADRTDGMEDLLHLMACRSAIKAGQRLTGDEAAGLLQRWLATPQRDFCPHGRPIILRFCPADLEKLFKRKTG